VIRAVLNAWSFSCVSGTPFGVYVSFELGAADPRLAIRAKDAARKQRNRKLTKFQDCILSAPPIKEFVVLSRSDNFAPTPKTLIGASFFLLLAAAIFGGLNIAKVKTLRSAAAQATTARDAAERSRLQHDKELKARQSAIATEQTKLAEGEAKTGAAEGQLTQILNEKKQLEARLQDKEADILTLQKQIEEKQPAWPIPAHRPVSSSRRS
jgi:hypothetical protein